MIHAAIRIGLCFAFAAVPAAGQACDWSALGDPTDPGVDSEVRALRVFDDGSGPALYVGGFFGNAGGLQADGLVRWDGAAWSAVVGPGGGINNDRVYALVEFDDGTGPALYVGGDFSQAGGQTANGIAKWDGTDWSPLTGPGGTGVEFFVNDMVVFDDGGGEDLYVAGRFLTAGGIYVGQVARWDGQTWSALQAPTGGPGVNNITRALAVYDDGNGEALYIGGTFTLAGGQPANRIVKWDGTAFTPLSGPSGNGMDLPVLGLGVYDDGSGPALYAGGFFTAAGGVTVNGVAKWDGSAWSALSGPGGTGVNTDGGVAGFEVFDDGSGPALYAGGLFSHAGGVAVNGVARWNGAGWSAVSGTGGVGVSNYANVLRAYDDVTGPALIVGGFFDAAGGILANNVAAWACEPAGGCDADITNDGLLNFFDIAQFAALFQAQDPIADFNNDGLFNFFDFSVYLTAFNAGCP